MALALAPHFAHISALDPSEKMVSVGLQPSSSSSAGAKHISYGVGSVESLPYPPHSIDLAIAGQAAHWFDHARAWAQLARVLRPRGTVAYVGYGELAFTKSEGATRVFREELMHGNLGTYWPQPGRGIVEGLLDAVPFPVSPALGEGEGAEGVLGKMGDLEWEGRPLASRIEEPTPLEGEERMWDAATAVRLKGSTAGGWALRRRWTMAQLEAYIRTSSAYHAHAAANPEDAQKRGRGGREGDVVERRVAQIAEVLKGEGVRDGAEVDVEWPLVVMMIKRNAE